MKALEQLVVRARTRVREERARLGLGGRPARLVVRLDDHDAPGAIPESTLKLDDWFDAIVRVVEWSGALPVVIVGRADHRLLAEVVRFAHRLECPTSLRTSAAGLTQARADELVDCGLEQAIVRVAGVTDAVQRDVLGETAADTRSAIAALRAARASRGASLDIVIEVPFDDRSVTELRAIVEEARVAGVDGVRIASPWAGGPYAPAAMEAARWLEGQRGFDRTGTGTYAALRALRGGGPGVARTSGSCPVGALQVELLPDATVRCCPFKADTARLGDAMEPAWTALAGHRAAIKACDRACAHPLLTA